MEMLTKNKGMIATIIILILGVFFYNSFFNSEAISIPDESSTLSVGNDLLKTFEDLKMVTLDQTLFSSKGYLLLTDFSMDIPQQATGRTNPFNIIGRD